MGILVRYGPSRLEINAGRSRVHEVALQNLGSRATGSKPTFALSHLLACWGMRARSVDHIRSRGPV